MASDALVHACQNMSVATEMFLRIQRNSSREISCTFQLGFKNRRGNNYHINHAQYTFRILLICIQKKIDLLQGYLQKTREDDLFTTNDSKVIFGNIEQLYTFHKEFVEDLQCCIDHSAMENSCVGATFLKHVNFFVRFPFLVTS